MKIHSLACSVLGATATIIVSSSNVVAAATAAVIDNKKNENKPNNDVKHLRQKVRAMLLDEQEHDYPLDDFGGSPHPSLFPLQLCEGDCDVDEDCGDGLKCKQRNKGDLVPGCYGELGSRTDFCVVDESYVPPLPDIRDFGSTPHHTRFPLGRCEGDCDHDADCNNGLFCFQRGANQPIPGCNGNPGSRSDFCVPDVYKSLLGRIKDYGGTPDEELYPLQWCEGDCDHDYDCKEGLVCHQRDAGDDIPGCTGDVGSNSDFCIREEHE
eukprot:CAMPEP_0119549168 /NCGR_PEP_ID=MMETSP1352-20130426/2937_1 /TAXON_ID=265584 /ORGANISM="Stauroneis constricta, Strain CCMP1120" /LENGTH=266 /DNA_ID=CAMNT_0007594657 /DNA_START=242 /DNA_END=1042 /DNA_ORIENTATION=+